MSTRRWHRCSRYKALVTPRGELCMSPVFVVVHQRLEAGGHVYCPSRTSHYQKQIYNRGHAGDGMGLDWRWTHFTAMHS